MLIVTKANFLLGQKFLASLPGVSSGSRGGLSRGSLPGVSRGGLSRGSLAGVSPGSPGGGGLFGGLFGGLSVGLGCPGSGLIFVSSGAPSLFLAFHTFTPCDPYERCMPLWPMPLRPNATWANATQANCQLGQFFFGTQDSPDPGQPRPRTAQTQNSPDPGHPHPAGGRGGGCWAGLGWAGLGWAVLCCVVLCCAVLCCVLCLTP